MSNILTQLLHKRGLTDPDTTAEFLSPDYNKLSDPDLLPDIDVAVDRIIAAITNNDRITIYADYDADGIPGAVVLHDCLQKLGYSNFDVYFPHRHTEGYGVHTAAVEQIAESGTDLLITIDVGVGAVPEIKRAKELGLDVIIIDHHEPGSEVPPADAIVDPKCSDDDLTPMCAAGVVYQVVRALLAKLRGMDNPPVELPPEGWEKWLLDMVGIATLSDMVPLTGENRILAHFGLKVLRKSRRLGLKALFAKTKLAQRHLVEEDITFTISPRLNAASRMAHPIDAFQVLSETDAARAIAASDHLCKLNDQRKKLTAQTMKQVHTKLRERDLREVIVVGDPSWSPGILSIISTKVAEEHNRPTFVWCAQDDGKIKGSARAANGVGVLELLDQVPEKIIPRYGGHHEAGGFHSTREQIHFLEDALVDVYLGLDHSNRSVTLLSHDLELGLDQVTRTTYNELEQLSPFGVANPRPMFKFSAVTIHEVRHFGKASDHLELKFSDSTGRIIKAIQFFATTDSYDIDLAPGSIIDLLGHIELSRFLGKEELRLRIVDVAESVG